MSRDAGYSNFLLSNVSLIDDRQVCDIDSILDNAHDESLRTSAPPCPTVCSSNISVFDQQKRTDSQDEIGTKVLEISKKLDVVIDLLFDNNNLLKEYLQKK